MKLADSIKNEINKVKGMDKQKRIEYFKSYYLLKCVFILIGLVLLAWFIKDTFFKKEAVCMGCAYGVELTDRQRSALTSGYLDYFKLNPKKCSAVVATDNMFEGTEQQMDANSQEMALFAQIAAGEIYYLILDKETLDMYANGGIYSTLSEVLSQETIDSLEGMTVDVKDYDSDNMYATAIDLRKLGFLNDDGQKGYLVFTIARPDDGYPERFLGYLKDISTEL